MNNPNCDGMRCTSETGEVRVYPMGGNGNAILCRSCYGFMMRHVKRSFPKDSIEPWEALQIYEIDTVPAGHISNEAWSN